MSLEEREFLNLYLQLSDKDKGNIKGRMELLVEQKKEFEAKEKRNNIKIKC